MKQIKKYGRKLLMIYWKVIKPLSLGTRVMVIYKNEILLVKHTYVDGYYLPGGGVKKKELFKLAAARELFEETGIKTTDFELFGVFQGTQEKKYTLNIVFLYKTNKKPEIAKQDDELLEAKFFPLNELPMDVSPGTKRRISEYLSNKYPTTEEW